MSGGSDDRGRMARPTYEPRPVSQPRPVGSAGGPPGSEPRPPTKPPEAPRRPPLRIGRIVITPTRVILTIALIGSVVFVLYSISVRDKTAVPLLATGSLVLGIVFALLAVAGATGAISAARSQREGLAFAKALLGGVAGMIAFAWFAVATVLALVWQTPPP